MKKIGKESVVEEWYMDGQFQRRASLQKNVYEDKNGDLYVHFIKGYRKAERINGQVTLKIMAKTIQPINIFDWVKQAAQQ